MTEPTIPLWVVNADPARYAPGVGHVVLRADRTDAQRLVLGLHQVMAGPAPARAAAVEITVPEYRGKSTIAVLGWLAANRLAAPGARVSWRMTKTQGPDSIHRLLTGQGWQLDKHRDAGVTVLTGPAPDPGVLGLPEPARFTAELGVASVDFAADYGVFSPRAVDEGTRLLFDVVLRRTPAVATLADIGIGYGALAIGLVRNGIAPRAVATDVDCIALWLADLNAASAAVSLTTVCSAEPAAVPDTELTVCNVPTHIDVASSAALMAGLTARAGHGRLQIVVHAALEQRYTGHLTAAGLRSVVDRGAHHVVLTADG